MKILLVNFAPRALAEVILPHRGFLRYIDRMKGTGD